MSRQEKARYTSPLVEPKRRLSYIVRRDRLDPLGPLRDTLKADPRRERGAIPVRKRRLTILGVNQPRRQDGFWRAGIPAHRHLA